ncbi:nucleotide exchange factor GrpE [Paenibacillus sedimenti]|uniref:Protein GrpE n=1 Tax=Paenibacillus sedimenti TaxID=2770274 RepID=A0A926QH33_9BACL|nr:nucleotide exchange factor GrpE [Paenibacillus sedimenti]MBD0379075.1 nucleotide exchange factor GrpE [Paenibacillus sedimenti]
MSNENKQTAEQDVNATYAAESEQAAEQQAEAADQSQAGSEEAGALSELDQLRMQSDENYQRFLRVQADFDNFRRRSRAEKEDFAKYASLKLIEQLLPVVDNFDRALSSSKEAKDFDALVKGLDMTFRQLDQVLTQEGLKPIEAVGQPFNPEFHQAIMQVESEEHEEGIVVEELQKGYMLKDKVIRPAMVKVSV